MYLKSPSQLVDLRCEADCEAGDDRECDRDTRRRAVSALA